MTMEFNKCRCCEFVYVVNVWHPDKGENKVIDYDGPHLICQLTKESLKITCQKNKQTSDYIDCNWKEEKDLIDKKTRLKKKPNRYTAYDLSSTPETNTLSEIKKSKKTNGGIGTVKSDRVSLDNLWYLLTKSLPRVYHKECD